MSGRRITLRFVVAPALAQAATDPVFVLVGGPGQSASEFGARTSQFDKLRTNRDIVYVDQRGTGGSHALNCNIYGDDVQSHFRELFPADRVRACRAELEKTADLTAYTTPNAMDDLNEIREVLGYEKINLYGTSYGTWATLEVLRTHADHVRSAVLAGTATVQTKFPLHFAKGAQNAVNRLIDDCRGDEQCRAAFPDLQQDFDKVIAALSEKPASFNLEGETIVLTHDAFTERLRLMLYDLPSASRIPSMIHQAARDNWVPFAAAALARSRQSANLLSMGMYFTVTCSESIPTINDDDIERETTGTFVGSYRTKVHQRACAEWPRAQVPVEYYQPVRSQVPVLMFSGMLDPATPVDLATSAAKYLPNSRIVTIRNAAHSYSSPCLQNIATNFIAAGSANGLDTACVETIRRPAFAR
jgi:pimeloyl-ACP methyl ester carboxylesterase